MKRTMPTSLHPTTGAFAASLLCTLFLLCGCGDPSARDWSERGLEDLRRGAVRDGAAALEKAVANEDATLDDAELPALWNWLGLARWQNGNRDGAKAAFEACIGRAPDHFAATYNLGTLWLEEGNMAKGIPLLRTAAGLDPADTSALLAIAEFTTRQGRWDFSRRTYLVARKRDPRNPAIATGLGRVALLSGDMAQAETAFMEALELEKNYPPALYNLGVMHAMAQGHGEQAAEYFRRYLEAAPDGPRAEAANQRLGGATIAQASFGQAAGAAAPGGAPAAPPPENATDVWKAAAARKSVGDTAGAAELAARAVELAAEGASPDGGAEIVRRALAEYANAAGVQLAAGTFWEGRRNLDGAQAAYQRAQAIEPQNTTALAALARVAAEREEYDTAVMALRQLLAADPRNADALWTLADLYGDKLGMTGKGIAAYRDFERECSTDPRVRDVEARIQALAEAEAALPPMDEMEQ